MQFRKLKHEPCIIVAHDQYGDRYFDGSTIAKATAAYKKLLRERFDENWYDPGSPPTEKPLDDDAIEALPLGLKKQALEHRNQYKRAMQYYEQDADFHETVSKLLDGQFTPDSEYHIARGLLEFRDHAEYERISHESFESVDE